MNIKYLQHDKASTNKACSGSASILVVDDMATNRGLVKAVLSPKKYTIYEAESGEQAIKMMSGCYFIGCDNAWFKRD